MTKDKKDGKYKTEVKFELELDETADNTIITPLYMLFDTSYSMNKYIDQSMKDLQTFIETIGSDDYLRDSVAVSIFSFNDDVKTVYEKEHIDNIYINEKDFQVDGWTDMGKAVTYVKGIIDKHKKEWKDNNQLYKAPMIVLISDGEPTDSIENISQTIADLVQQKRMVFMGIGLGDDSDMSSLKKFNPKGQVIKAPKHDDLKELLVWLSGSLSQSSRAGVNETVYVDKPDSKFEMY